MLAARYKFLICRTCQSVRLTMSTIEILLTMRDVVEHYISPMVKLVGIIGLEKKCSIHSFTHLIKDIPTVRPTNFNLIIISWKAFQ